ENRVLTQTRGAEPYRGMLRVDARCCSCWEHRPGGRTFSADPALACRHSLPTGLLRNSAHHIWCIDRLWGRRGEQSPPPLRPGYVVEMSVEAVGTIRNCVAARPHI